jgi:LysM repeat protein
MNNANPLIPQGSLLERKAKGKPHLRVAIFIVAAHLVFLGFLLVGQGCKREDGTASKTGSKSTNESSLPPLSQEALYSTTNAAGQFASTNPPPFDLAGSNAALPQNLTAPSQTPIDQTPIAAAQEYVVVKGDSFYTIGKKFGVPASAIAKANPGVDSTRLKIGQKLTVPAPAPATGARTVAEAGLSGAENVYVVKAGDTLSRIAKANGVSIDDIRTLNGLKTDRINIGQKLKLPAKNMPATIPATTNPATPAARPTGGTSNL